MKIISLSVKNNFFGWEFDEIKFSSNLTLLVGVSGVGKTQILKAIDSLQDVANGGSISGFEWSVTFSTIAGKEFLWKGAFSILESGEKTFNVAFNDRNDDEEKPKPVIVSEVLKETTSSKDILIRNKDGILFNGKDMPKFPSNQSMIFTLREEENIKDIVDAFRKITFKDHTRRGIEFTFSLKPLVYLKEAYKTIETIKNSSENIRVKLLLCSESNLDVFDIIKDKFIDIFPQVEDMKIQQAEDDFPFGKDRATPVIYIKEKGVPKWIKENRMSSGMLRTIIHICEMFLSNDDSVILIDEFENSLGVNCIDILTDDLIHENSTLQFIATSHHPYIINNIPYEYWKIVSRKGGRIQVRDASSYNLGKSKQDAFIQLTKILEKQS